MKHRGRWRSHSRSAGLWNRQVLDRLLLLGRAVVSAFKLSTAHVHQFSGMYRAKRPNRFPANR